MLPDALALLRRVVAVERDRLIAALTPLDVVSDEPPEPVDRLAATRRLTRLVRTLRRMEHDHAVLGQLREKGSA